jgi:hypothetical protein
MTAKPDDTSRQTDQGRREFLRTGSIIAGGMLLSQTVSSAQAQQIPTTGIPLDTQAKDFPLLTAAEIAMMTPRAQGLTKADLITLSRVQSNREELTDEMALGITAGDLNSLEQAFANYGVGRFQGLAATADDGVSCCCTCTPCCSCCASSVVKPVRVL